MVVNVIEKHPNALISKHGNLEIKPVDEDALRKMIEDELARLRSQIDGYKKEIEDLLNRGLSVHPDYGSSKEKFYYLYQIAAEQAKKGYFEVPFDCVMTANANGVANVHVYTDELEAYETIGNVITKFYKTDLKKALIYESALNSKAAVVQISQYILSAGQKLYFYNTTPVSGLLIGNTSGIKRVNVDTLITSGNNTDHFYRFTPFK